MDISTAYFLIAVASVIFVVIAAAHIPALLGELFGRR
jgi:hypothetical protein